MTSALSAAGISAFPTAIRFGVPPVYSPIAMPASCGVCARPRRAAITAAATAQTMADTTCSPYPISISRARDRMLRRSNPNRIRGIASATRTDATICDSPLSYEMGSTDRIKPHT